MFVVNCSMDTLSLSIYDLVRELLEYPPLYCKYDVHSIILCMTLYVCQYVIL